jgi:putative CocE/NonD family hydrolase
MRSLLGCVLVLAAGTTAAGPAAARTSVSYEISTREAWITMRDGVRLSATIYQPAPHRRGEKFPAVLEYLPYRKDEEKNHSQVHEYFARHGFVSAEVDIRGTGRSEGQLPGREYSQQEQQDGEQVIAWLAHQPWSNGNVGMFGISWGGFNSVQMAMRNPPGLKAIIAIDATEDLFHDDVHFIDGLMHVDEYELNVDLTMAVTRAPDFPTDEASLAARFDRPPWILAYKRQQRQGAFWDEPVRPLGAIRVPVFMIGGMLDGYRDSIPRMLQGITAPTKALLGPWNHSEPHDAVPGPAIEWRDQALEWWDHWLRGRANGAMSGPRLAVYMNHSYPPDVRIREIPGEWRAEAQWPPAGLQPRTFYLGADHSLRLEPADAARHELAYRPAATQEGGGPDFWWGDVNGDQRSVDAYSLVYDSAPLREPLSILGRPRACLNVAAAAPVAHWFVRLSDVAPDGITTLVSGAGLAGTQRDSMREPTPLVAGREYSLCLDLHLISWVFPPGHQLRIAVSNSMWPMIWPTPYAMTTTLGLGGATGSRIELPVVPAQGPLPRPVFAPPATDTAGGTDAATAEMNVSSNVPGLGWTVSRNPVAQQGMVEWRGGSSDDYPWGREVVSEHMVYRADDLHPETSSIHGEASMNIFLRDRRLEWSTLLDVHSDRQNFYVDFKRELRGNDKLIRRKEWHEAIPRDGQ